MVKYNRYTTEVLKKADYYTAVSSPLKDKIVKSGRKQCQIVPNFVNIDKFHKNNMYQVKNSNNFNLIHIIFMKFIKLKLLEF